MHETTLPVLKSPLLSTSAQKLALSAVMLSLITATVAGLGLSTERTTSGTARAASQPQGAQVPPADVSSQADPPPRPVRQEGRWLDVSRVKPCDLLSPGQLASIGASRSGHEIELPAFQATGCTWSDTGGINTVVPVTHEGIGVWFEGKRTGRLTRTMYIEEFPAITVQIDGYSNRCDVMVDTKEGEYLNASHSRSTKKLEVGPTPCDSAIELAREAIRTLNV
ncbi:DUF3558 domain-containing protein [Actinosynnema pretiosum subsp. pretiosum]|uniref:DUF3558 domain-containing protein n=1 Tax=Actinosynnema pretiosum subsp. pretiosum TaxID=103721 RepID=A0AA45LCP9_9PSEU|nr:DUF3558 domain-containing protein [Actinosynnema pretiosum subsp. pretiosum]